MPDAPFEQGRPLQAGYNYEWTFVSSPTPTLYLRRKPEHQRKPRSSSNIRPHAILPYAIPPARKTAGRIVPSHTSPKVANPAASVVGKGPSGTPRSGSVPPQPSHSNVDPGHDSSETVPSRSGVYPHPLDSLQAVQPSLRPVAGPSPRASQLMRTEAGQLPSIDEDEDSLFGDAQSPSSDGQLPPTDPQRRFGDVESPHGDVHPSLVASLQQRANACVTQILPATVTELGGTLEFQLPDIHPAADASLWNFDQDLFSNLSSSSFLATPHDNLYPDPASSTPLTPDWQSFLNSWPAPDPLEAHRFAGPSYIPPNAPYVWGPQDPITGLHCPQDAVFAGFFQPVLPSPAMQAPLYPPTMSLLGMDASLRAQSADSNLQDIIHWPQEELAPF